jgi:hypothetical protein
MTCVAVQISKFPTAKTTVPVDFKLLPTPMATVSVQLQELNSMAMATANVQERAESSTMITYAPAKKALMSTTMAYALIKATVVVQVVQVVKVVQVVQVVKVVKLTQIHWWISVSTLTMTDSPVHTLIVTQVLTSILCNQFRSPLFALLVMTHGPAFVLLTRVNAQSSPSSIRRRAFVNTTHMSSA